jgi:hypothetical protein
MLLFFEDRRGLKAGLVLSDLFFKMFVRIIIMMMT